MPMIMDDLGYNMDTDDLFGDSEAVVPLPTIASPPVKGVARRLDELSASGCCQKMAWSKNGCVAYITPDGYSINLRVFARDPETGKWDLGEASALEVPAGHDDFQFVHLSWSHLGNDLAVMGAAGHVMIFSCQMALDRMTFVRAEIAQPEAEADAVVGMHWCAILPYEQKNHIAWSATGKDDKWTFQTSSHSFNDAGHPWDGKASIIYLKRRGELKYRFQQADSSWHETATTLGSMVSTRETFTHAAFVSNNDNTLLLAAYDVSGRIHLYRVEAKWNVPSPKPAQHPKVYEVPELQVSEICTEDHCYPTSSAVVSGDINTGAESKIRLPAQLTHLNFLPRTPEQNDGTLPTILAIFSTPPNIVSFDQTQPQQNPFSILVRWQIHQTQQNQLHSSLEKVTSKKRSVSSIPGREVFLFKKMPDIIMHSVVLEFYPLWYNMILAFCHNDGTIEFRKRATMDSMVPDFNTETVTSLPQAGFGFPSTDPSLHVALSPNYCLAACMHQDGTIKLRSMEYSYGNLSSTEPDSRHSAALAALVLQSSTAANQYFSSDDIFSIIHSLSIPPSRVTDFIALLFQGLNVNIDCGVDDSANNHLMLLGRSPFFVKTLSAAHLLGLSGTVERTIPSKLAWMILNIKYITQILTTIARMHGQIDKTPLRPEVVPQFVGICRWIMHFMVYILDDILALAFDLRNSSPDTTSNSKGNANIDINKAIHANNHPAILLLLSSFPRMMLKLWSQPLAWVVRTAYQYSSSSHPQANIPAELRRVYAPLHQALSDLPFDWRLFESLVSEAHALVRGTYRVRNIPEAERNHVERQLILGHIPDLLLPVVKRLLGESIFGKEDSTDPSAQQQQQQPCLADKIDIGRVMFFDTIWLGLSTSNISKRFHGTHIVDVCQKTVIRGVTAQNPPGFTSNGNNNNSSTSQSQQSRGRSDTVNTLTSANGGKPSRPKKMRRCVRCGAYMEDVVQGMPGYANHHVSWLMGVAKHCVCGNSWMLVDDVTSGMLMDGFKGKGTDKANGMSRGLPMGSALDGNWGD